MARLAKIAALAACSLFLGACSVLPQAERGQSRPQSNSTQTYSAHPQARQCLAGLSQAGLQYVPLPDRYLGPGCSTLNAVELASLAGDETRLEISNLGPVTCPLASNFAAWARFGVDRAARQLLGSPLARIETMGSYACRNVAGTSRRSAHASAEAIDIGAFVLQDGRRISVLNGWTGGSEAEREFLRIVHGSACKRFGTVLGPGYNAAHRDHFHLELGGGNFCR